MKEDELTNKIIERRSLKEEDYRETTEDVNVNSEVHYNYYGTRGVADLHISKETRKIRGRRILQETERRDLVLEIKANPSNANEVLRQFNKMTKYFYKDQDRKEPEKFKFELAFIASEDNYNHVLENKEMYIETYRKDNTLVSFRSVDNPKPVPIASFGRCKIGSDEWKDVVKLNNEKIFEDIFGEE